MWKGRAGFGRRSGLALLLSLGLSVSAQAQNGVDLTGSIGGPLQGPNGPCDLPAVVSAGPGNWIPVTFQNLGSLDARPATYRLWMSKTNRLPLDVSSSTSNVAFVPDGTIDLPGFSTQQVCLEVTVPSVPEGEYFVALQMDPEGDYPDDLNLANNVAFSPEPVGISGPSLRVSDIVSPSECFRGRPTDIGFSLTNNSTVDDNGFSVGLFLVAQGGGLSTTAYRVGQIDNVSLMAGCAITVRHGAVVFSNSDSCYQWPATPAIESVPSNDLDHRELPPGVYYAGVIADVTNLVLPRLGRNENHLETWTPTVCDLPLPDFSIQAAEIAVAPSVSAGSGVEVARTIRNVGASAGTATYAYFLNLNSGATNLEVHQGGVPIPVALPSGKLTYAPTVTLDYPGDGAYEDQGTDLLLIPAALAPPPGAGYTLALVLDPFDQVRELDKANNRAGVGPIEITKSDLAIATVDLPPALSGVPYSFAFQASGAFGEYAWSILAGAPPQMTLSKDGLLAGTPAQLGTWQFLIRVGSGPESQMASVVFRVVPPSGTLQVVKSGPELPPAAVGEDYAAQLAAVGGTPPYDWTIPANQPLPEGLSLSLTGLLFGTPTSQAVTPNGPGAVAIIVTDQTGSSKSDTYLLEIEEAGGIEIMTAEIPPQRVGEPWVYELRATGCHGTNPNAPWCHWTIPSAQELPEGLTLTTQGSGSTSVGQLAELSPQRGFWTFDVQVADDAGHQAQRHLMLQVFDSLLLPPGQILPAARAGELYATQLAGPKGVDVSWRLFSGDLPPGLVLDSDGSIVGRVHGKVGIRTYAFAAAARDAQGNEALQPEAIAVLDSPRQGGCATGGDGPMTIGLSGFALFVVRSRRGLRTPAGGSRRAG